ncbi:hypothetical protein Tco_0926812 [Tanacetum coccineum]|uniref:Reverse transcriptase domain-containing protein n=1 Tax=Tanacetum coccineum TaxID=301880 RepID=A0ABQ5DCT7_9ASTR
MQAARDRQKSYADLKRKPMEFEVGDKVMLKVSPWKGVVRFGKRGKLNPRRSIGMDPVMHCVTFWIGTLKDLARGDGVPGIKQHHRDPSSYGVGDLVTASGRSRLNEDLESST